MANITKVEFDGVSLIDLTTDTVGTNTSLVSKGYTFHGNNGAILTGSMENGTITASGSKQQSVPTISQSGNVITASVAATSGTVTPSVTTAGYVSSTAGTKTAGTFTMSASSATYTIPAGGCTVSGGGLTQGTASGGGLSGGGISGGDISGGGLSAGAGEVSLTAGSGSVSASGANGASLTYCGTSAPTDGLPYIKVTGYGTVSGQGRGLVSRATITRATITRASVTRAAFSQAVTRAAVTDTHTAGYIPAKSATTVISAATSTVSLAAGTLAAGTSAATTSAATSAYSNWSSSSSKQSNTATSYYKLTTPMCFSKVLTGQSAIVASNTYISLSASTGSNAISYFLKGPNVALSSNSYYQLGTNQTSCSKTAYPQETGGSTSRLYTMGAYICNGPGQTIDTSAGISTTLNIVYNGTSLYSSTAAVKIASAQLSCNAATTSSVKVYAYATGI